MLHIFSVGEGRKPKWFLLLRPCVCVCVQDKKGQELPNVVELEIANMEKLVHQQREPEAQ